ncbi:MAG: U32 family peptidase [Lachnospiraceae bacterium]|nr:U32 family peptidase [Lachnospiraceae bacterium]
MDKPEILAPGSSAGAVYAALRAGCDAVYIGGKRFGARAFADNPETDELIRLMDDVHMHGKKMYLTVNTVLTEGEFPALYEYIKQVYKYGVDAVIVQDMGVLRFIHKEFPDLPIHASTQMSVLRAEAADILKGYGVTRVVPARELTLSEIGELDRGTDLEIEVFVHGALCCSMSGQCLLSSLIGGRSGNRGACAQPCRKKYTFNNQDSKYFLSLKDLCALPYIPELIQNGVDSFKIEGRMKKPEYVACAAYMYGKYTALYFEMGYDAYKNEVMRSEEYKRDYTALMDIYNRGGFTAGYLIDKKVSDEIFAYERPGHSGVRIGRMRTGRVITIEEDVYPHDVLEIRDDSGNAVHEHTIKDVPDGRTLRINTGYNAGKIQTGYEVFRIRNNFLIDSIHEQYIQSMPPIRVKGKFFAAAGKNMSLTLAFGDITATVYGSVCEKAANHPAVIDDVVKKIKVSGDSIYEWDNLAVIMEDGLFLSAGELKSLRRSAFKKLYEETVKSFRRCDCIADSLKCGIKGAVTELIAECRTNGQFAVIKDAACVDTIYIQVEDFGKEEMYALDELLGETDKPVYIVLPRVARSEALGRFRECYDWPGLFARRRCLKGYVVSSLEEISYVKKTASGSKRHICIRTADNMYVRNRQAYACMMELGAEHVSLSVEMADREYREFEGMCADVLIYGKVTAMVMLNHRGASGSLRDGYGNAYKVVCHNNSEYTEILNYEARDIIEDAGRYRGLSKRVRFTDEGAGKVRDVLKGCEII